MARAHRNSEAINILGTHFYSPRGLPQHVPQGEKTQGETNFIDGSGPIFSLYMEMATEEDKKMAEDWKADADGILIFTASGLFSAAVASLISVSIQDIRPNPQDTSNFYLANIYQTIADPNRPNISSSLPSSPPSFSPPNYAIWVNALWFLSLVISISCALLATLLQQWARRYLKANQPHYSPHKRARIRAFFAEGVGKFLLPWAVEALPTLLHVSLFLFFAGLVVFLWNVNLTIFKLVLSWVGICTALYGCITFMLIFRHDSPYYTPLSLLVWNIMTGIPFLTFWALRRLTQIITYLSCFSHGADNRFQTLENRYRKLLAQGMQKAAEDTALNAPPEIDTRAFLWTLDSLDEDHELERFFSGLPGFRSSKLVNDPLPSLTTEQKWKILNALIGLSDRTFSSDLLPEAVKSQRAVICAKAIDLADIPQAFVWVLSRIVNQNMPVQSAGIARLVRGWDDGKSVRTTNAISAVVSSVVARAQRRGELWYSIASDELGVPETVLRDHAAHGDSLSLAILIHVTRQQFSLFEKPSWPKIEFSKVLGAASKFKVRDTKPELQHEFCALWNQIVIKAQNDHDTHMVFLTLGVIRNVYIALHQGTDSAPTPFSTSTSDADGILFQPSSYPLCSIASHIHDDSAPTSFTRTAALAPASLAGPDRLPSIIYLSATESPASTPASVSSPDADTVQHIADRRTSSDILDVPSPPSPIQVLDDMPPTKSHLSPLAPGPSHSRLSSAPAVIEGEGSAKAALNQETDALDPPSAIRENMMAALDLPPQSPSPPSVADVAIAGPSWRSLGAEYTRDRPPHPLHSQYDVV